MLFAVAESRVPRIAVLVRDAYGGGYLAMSGAPMDPDAVIAPPTAKPALMGPDAAVNGIHYNRIQAIEDPEERNRFVAQKQPSTPRASTCSRSPTRTPSRPWFRRTTCAANCNRRLRVYRRRSAVPVLRRQAVTAV